jgi:hypothetical protein
MIAQFFFKLAVHLKLYHWNTSSYARHIASGTLFDGIILAMDNFIEVYQGRYGKVFTHVEMNIDASDDSQIIKILNEAKTFFSGLTEELNPETDTDLLSIRDDILAQINKTLYLFTFK